MARTTGRLPRALQERPEIDECDIFYIEAFHTLSHFRKGDDPISFKDIAEYADRTGENVLEFASIITQADKAFLKVLREDKKIEVNKGKK